MNEELRKFDKRVVERNLNKGLISQKDLDSHLKALPDMESEAEELILDAEEEEQAEEAETSEESQSEA